MKKIWILALCIVVIAPSLFAQQRGARRTRDDQVRPQAEQLRDAREALARRVEAAGREQVDMRLRFAALDLQEREAELEAQRRRMKLKLQAMEHELDIQRRHAELDLEERELELEQARRGPQEEEKDEYWDDKAAQSHHWEQKKRHDDGAFVCFILFVKFCLFILTVNVLLAVWVFVDIRKRKMGSGIWVALVLLTGLCGAAVYALVRIGDKCAADNT